MTGLSYQQEAQQAVQNFCLSLDRIHSWRLTKFVPDLPDRR